MLAEENTTMNVTIPKRMKSIVHQLADDDQRSASNWVTWVISQEVTRRVGYMADPMRKTDNAKNRTISFGNG